MACARCGRGIYDHGSHCRQCTAYVCTRCYRYRGGICAVHAGTATAEDVQKAAEFDSGSGTPALENLWRPNRIIMTVEPTPTNLPRAKVERVDEQLSIDDVLIIAGAMGAESAYFSSWRLT